MEIQEIVFEVKALVGKIELPMVVCQTLEIGDILLLDQEVGKPFPIIVAEEKRFLGFPGLDGTHKAIKVESKNE